MKISSFHERIFLTNKPLHFCVFMDNYLYLFDNVKQPPKPIVKYQFKKIDLICHKSMKMDLNILTWFKLKSWC